MLAPAIPSLPPPGCSFSLFALSEFFTIHFSSFAWDRFNSGFHPFTASQIANPHSPLVFQCLLKKLPPLFLLPASSLPPLASPASPRSPSLFLSSLLPFPSLSPSLCLFLPPSASPPLRPPSSAGQEFCARPRDARWAGAASAGGGARPGAGRGRSAGAAAAGVAGSARGQITRRRRRRRPAGPALSALSRGLRRTERARSLRPGGAAAFIPEVLCSAQPAGPPQSVPRRLLRSRPLCSPAPSL